MGGGKAFEYIQYGISDIICRIAVPLFYIVSGYLFFIKSDFSFRTYSLKLNKRIKTVLIPYILWNIIYLIVIGVVEILFPSFRSGATKLITHYNMFDYVYSLWDTNLINDISGTGEPICFQFWFLRDLMVSMIIVPLISLLFKSKIIDIVILLSLAFLWFIDFKIPVSGFSIVSLLFFYIGLFLHKYKMNIFSNYIYRYSLISYIILFFILENNHENIMVNRISILVGIILFSNIIYRLRFYCKHQKLGDFLASSSFFLYASHSLILTGLVKLSVKILPPNDIIYTMAFLLNPIFTIIICLTTYWLLQRYLPNVGKILTGNR